VGFLWEREMLRLRNDAVITRRSDADLCTALRGLVAEMTVFAGKRDTIERSNKPQRHILRISSILSTVAENSLCVKVLPDANRKLRTPTPLPLPTAAHATEDFDYNRYKKNEDSRQTRKCYACQSPSHLFRDCKDPKKLRNGASGLLQLEL
jgi:hypothetical protein